jgi:hypothetical protein
VYVLLRGLKHKKKKTFTAQADRVLESSLYWVCVSVFVCIVCILLEGAAGCGVFGAATGLLVFGILEVRIGNTTTTAAARLLFLP